jgi:hypothetical protein
MIGIRDLLSGPSEVGQACQDSIVANDRHTHVIVLSPLSSAESTTCYCTRANTT